jgi:conjugal transfer/type IV secretion protein DotA/TraY
MTRMKTFLLAVLFIFAMGLGVTTTPAYASAPPVDQLPADGSAPFKLANQDYFVGKLLAGFLGPVVNPNGDRATTTVTASGNLGEIFRTYNLGIAFFGTLIVMFLAVAGVLQSGQDGEFLGKRWSSMWVPIRFTVGSLLMLPLSATGYSFVQAMVLWIAVQGIGFADTIWATVVNKMVLGASGVQTWGVMPSEKLARNMMNSAICAAAVNTYTANNPVPYKITFNKTESQSLLTRTTTWSWGDKSAPAGAELSTVCGTFSYSYSISDLTSTYGMARYKIIQEHATQVEKMATDFSSGTMAYGVQLMEALDSTADSATAKANLKSLEDLINRQVILASASYSQRITAAADQVTGENTANDRAQKIAELTNYGFATAGAYYIELTRMQSAISSGMSAAPGYTPPTYGTLQSSIPMENFISVMSYFDRVNAGVSQAADAARGNGATETTSGRSTLVDTSDVIPSKVEFALHPQKSVEKTVNTFANKMLWTLVGTGQTSFDTAKAFQGGSFAHILESNTTGSAVLELKRRGDIILDWAGAIYTAKTLLKATIFAAHETAKTETLAKESGAQLVTGFAWSVIDDLASLLTAALSAWMAFGFMLATYVPMIPYLLWTGGLVGCLVLIAESLVACQLWAVMIIHPSGDGITSDHSRQGVMMLLVLFARGALMTMGLVMGIYMVDPLVTMVNDTFLIATTVLQKGTNFTGLFTTVGFGVVYTSLILSVMNRSFSMIHTVPDKVLGWVGGHAARLGESSAREDASNRIANVGQIVGTGGTGALVGASLKKREQLGAAPRYNDE